ncbi:MAG: protein kinase [Propionibacteriaceae bacterium]|nr:protein kinase [Propionibacteriaceae bacterium]
MSVQIGVPGVANAELIGQGGFGKVYRAHQDDLNRDVAVKVLTKIDLDAEARQRFTREARAIGRLSGHPNVVDVHTQGITTEGAPYLIMELCAAGSVGDRLKQGQRLSWQEASEIIVQIAGALQTAHAAGILHRDIKPANLLIDSYGTPKLADFGIAHIGTEASMTETGMMAGSPAHIAPELVTGDKPTPPSDVYSLASTLFAMITGQAPFVRETDTSILTLIQRITNEPAPHLSQWGVPAPIADLVAASLAKRPETRPQTCDAFARALMNARRQLGLPLGEYRVQRTPGEPDATVVPQGMGTPGMPPGFDFGGSPMGSPAGVPMGSPVGSPVHPSSAPSAHTRMEAVPGVPHQQATPNWPGAGSAPTVVGLAPGGHGQRHLELQPEAETTSRGLPVIIACWAIVVVCVILIAWMLWDRSQRLAAVPLVNVLLGP